MVQHVIAWGMTCVPYDMCPLAACCLTCERQKLSQHKKELHISTTIMTNPSGLLDNSLIFCILGKFFLFRDHKLLFRFLTFFIHSFIIKTNTLPARDLLVFFKNMIQSLCSII